LHFSELRVVEAVDVRDTDKKTLSVLCRLAGVALKMSNDLLRVAAALGASLFAVEMIESRDLTTFTLVLSC